MNEEELLKKLGREELERRIKEKQEAYAGLLNREGALYAIAREEGLAQDLPEWKEYQVERVYPKKEYRQGRYYSSLLLSGEGGRIRLVFWDQDADLASEYHPGDVIRVSGARERQGRNGPELHYQKNARIERIARESGQEKRAVVVRAFPRRYFGRGVVRTVIASEQGREERIVLWDDHAMAPVTPGQEIRVRGYREKNGEVHSTRTTSITLLAPEKLPAPRKRIAELSPGQPATVRAVVTRVYEPRIVDYCPRHNNTTCDCQDKRKSMVLRIVLSDPTGDVTGVLFFDTAEDLAGITGQALEREQNPLEAVKNNLLGEEKIFYGTPSQDGTELVVRGFWDYDPAKEAEG